MNTTVALTGMIPAIALIAAALTAPTSALLLWLYRRAVLRAMAQAAGGGAPSTAANATLGGEPRPLGISVIGPGARANMPAPAQSAFRDVSRRLWRAALVYLLAGLAYAIVLATPWMVFAEGGFIPTRFLWLLLCYSWPIVLAVSLVAATSRRERLLVGGIYLAILACIGLWALVRNAELSAGQLGFFWLWENVPGTVLLLAFLQRRVRAVGPLVLVFMVAGVTGAFLAIGLAGSSPALLRPIVAVGSFFGLGATTLFVLLHLIGFAAFGILGWWGLGRIGRCYRAKRTSDQALTLDAMWLLFAVAQSIEFAFEGWAWIFTGLVGFAAYKLVVRAGYSLTAAGSSGSMLLLLRVFSLGHRSQRLLDALSKRWLRAGSIGLIAGPDLATATVEPHEFLEFVGGRLSRQFVQGEADLERRVAEMDRRPDPDGRHRVSEFFCHADTWQMTMRRLAGECDAVLMDLRSFSPANQGCRYELEQLLAHVPLDRVVLVVDGSTDRAFLERALRDLWQLVPADSPNRDLGQPEARLFEARGESPAEIRTLLTLLFGASALKTAA
ncbi:MAG TPA: hypothetical protein VLM91_16315 [Candidatus Methylomirabilis sp.]|nr:hypothetical protein [Candidatus Methylomirabilis sp.]